MSRVIETARIYTIAIIQDIRTQVLSQDALLTALFRLHEIAQFYGQVPQSHDNESGRILARTSRHAAHALAAIPDGFTLQQFLDFFIILALDNVHDFARIISVELSRRTDGRAGTAVDTCIQAFLQAVVLHKEVIQSSHSVLFSQLRLTKVSVQGFGQCQSPLPG